MGVMDRRFSRAPIPMSGDRCALVRVRQRGTSVCDRPASVFRDEGGPTPRLSRAAERVVMQRHGNAKEYMFVNRGWRRRLQALLGRGMADNGRSARPTMNTAGTPRSLGRAGTGRYTIRRRALRHTIRRQAIPHAPGHTGRRARRRTRPHAMTIPDAMPGDEPYGTRRPSSSPGPATGDTARDDPLVPDDVW